MKTLSTKLIPAMIVWICASLGLGVTAEVSDKNITSDPLFIEAFEAVKGKKYEKALVLLSELETKGYPSGRIAVSKSTVYAFSKEYYTAIEYAKHAIENGYNDGIESLFSVFAECNHLNKEWLDSIIGEYYPMLLEYSKKVGVEMLYNYYIALIKNYKIDEILKNKEEILKIYKEGGSVDMLEILAFAFNEQSSPLPFTEKDEETIFGPLREIALKKNGWEDGNPCLASCADHYFQYGKVKEFVELLESVELVRLVVMKEINLLNSLLIVKYLREWRHLPEVRELAYFKYLEKHNRRCLYPEEYP